MNDVELYKVTKYYGKKLVIDSISMTIKEDSIYAFLGINGAGKTTTLRMISGLAKYESGVIKIAGEVVQFGKTIGKKTLVGYMPDCPEFPKQMTGKEYLKFMGELSGYFGKELNSKVDELLEIIDLRNIKTKVGAYSRGMKQRLGLAQAIIGDPKVLILDEPVSALDPIGKKTILNLIQKMSKHMTIILSTHMLSDVEKICDSVGILNNGKMIIEEDAKQLRKKYSLNKIVVEFESKPTIIQGLIKIRVPECTVEQSGNSVSITGKEDLILRKEVQNIIKEERAIIRSLKIEEPSIEDIFLKCVTKNE